MKIKIKNKIIWFGLLFTVLYAGCVPYAVIKEDYDFAKIRQVGVLDFSSAYESGGYNMGSAVADEFVRQLMRKGMDVVERQRLNAVLREHNLMQRGMVDLNTEARKKIKKILGVDAIITGTVIKCLPDRRDVIYFEDENGEVRNKIFLIDAELGVSVRMIDVDTGLIVWSSSYTSSSLDIEGAINYTVSVLLNSLKGKNFFKKI
jgi:curli biogenesis system outer membrane secretion channel CsgG